MEEQKKKEQKLEKQKTIKKPLIITTVILVLCLIAGGIFALTANSAGRRLADQLELGQKYLDELDYEQALVAFEAAISIDPKCVDAYLGMAEAYTGMGEYEKGLENLDRALELAGENGQVLDGLGNCLEKYIDVLIAEKRYDEVRALAEKYGNYLTGLDFGLILGELAENESGTVADPADAEQIQVTVKKTDIQADGVFNQEGYGSLTINGTDSLWDIIDYWEYLDDVTPPQTALVDAGGNFVFPYKSSYLTYYISDGVVSLAGSIPYHHLYGDDYEKEYLLPAYYHLDGSSVFVSESVTNRTDRVDGYKKEHEEETTVWYGGPIHDGYALMSEHVYTLYDYEYSDGRASIGSAGSGSEELFCIMDKNGAITYTLPEEYNVSISENADEFVGEYSLGGCGEGLFAVGKNGYDDNWDYFSEGKGYMDPYGNMVIDLSGQGYTELWPFCGGLAAVKSESGEIGFIDKTGSLVIPCDYEGVGSFSTDGICEVKKDGKWGYISTDGSEVIPFEYDNAYGAGGGLASVVKDGKCGLLDYSNRVIVPLEYDDISSFEAGVAYAIKDGALYIISR